jgi:hypothetical protein
MPTSITAAEVKALQVEILPRKRRLTPISFPKWICPTLNFRGLFDKVLGRTEYDQTVRELLKSDSLSLEFDRIQDILKFLSKKDSNAHSWLAKQMARILQNVSGPDTLFLLDFLHENAGGDPDSRITECCLRLFSLSKLKEVFALKKKQDFDEWFTVNAGEIKDKKTFLSKEPSLVSKCMSRFLQASASVSKALWLSPIEALARKILFTFFEEKPLGIDMLGAGMKCHLEGTASDFFINDDLFSELTAETASSARTNLSAVIANVEAEVDDYIEAGYEQKQRELAASPKEKDADLFDSFVGTIKTAFGEEEDQAVNSEEILASLKETQESHKEAINELRSLNRRINELMSKRKALIATSQCSWSKGEKANFAKRIILLEGYEYEKALGIRAEFLRSHPGIPTLEISKSSLQSLYSL